MTQTIYIRCAALHNRGDLVNKFFFQHRSVLGIEEWYTDEQLIPTSPVEIVEVKYSRKPYFLVEFREPLQEELLLRRTMPNDAIELSCQEEELSRISVALLQLGETVKELDGSSLIIMPAMDGNGNPNQARGTPKKKQRELILSPLYLGLYGDANNSLQIDKVRKSKISAQYPYLTRCPKRKRAASFLAFFSNFTTLLFLDIRATFISVPPEVLGIITTWGAIEQEAQNEIAALNEMKFDHLIRIISKETDGSLGTPLNLNVSSVVSLVQEVLREYEDRNTELQISVSTLQSRYLRFLNLVLLQPPLSHLLHYIRGERNTSMSHLRSVGTNTSFCCDQCKQLQEKIDTLEAELQGALLLRQDGAGKSAIQEEILAAVQSELNAAKEHTKKLQGIVQDDEERRIQWKLKESRLKGEAEALRQALKDRERSIIDLKVSLGDHQDRRKGYISLLERFCAHEDIDNEMIRNLLADLREAVKSDQSSYL
eukprot:gene5527-3986_t